MAIARLEKTNIHSAYGVRDEEDRERGVPVLPRHPQIWDRPEKLRVSYRRNLLVPYCLGKEIERQ